MLISSSRANSDASEQSDQLLENHHGDFHTNAGATREFLTMLFNSFYLWASMIEPFVPLPHKKTSLGYSVPATVIGSVMATVIAYGSAKIQHAIDKLNEKPVNYDDIKSASVANPHKHAHLSFFQRLYEYFSDYLTDSHQLSSLQVAQLTMAKVGQAGDLTGFAVGMLNAGSFSLNKTEQIAINSSIFIAGLIASEAAIRPSRNAMKFDRGTAKNVHRGQDDPNTTADIWTIIFLCAKIMQTGIANISFYATFADKMNGYEPNTPFGVSTQGLIDTLLPIIYVTASVVFFQYFFSIMNQGHYRPHKNTPTPTDIELANTVQNHPQVVAVETVDAPCISFSEKAIIYVLLIGRTLGTGTDCSVPILFMLNNILSPSTYLGVAVAGTAAGLLMSGSDYRTNKQNWDTWRAKNARWFEKKISRFASNASMLFSPCYKKPKNEELQESLLARAQHRQPSDTAKP